MNTKVFREERGTRRTATIVGVLFIIGTAAGVLSGVVTGSLSVGAPALLDIAVSNPSQVVLGALFVLIMGFALAMVPVLMFPILKRQNEALALAYVVFRGALETAMYIALALCWLLLVAIARQYADSGAAVASRFGSLGILLVKLQDPITAVTEIVFSLGALMLYYLLYRSKLIPRWISGWGIVAAIAYFAAGLIALFGTTLDIMMMPMLLQEMVMAIWLIARGFLPNVTERAREEARDV